MNSLWDVLLILQLNTLTVKTAFFCSMSCHCSPRHRAGELRAPANLSCPYVSCLARDIFSVVLHAGSSISELSSLPWPHAVSPHPLPWPHTISSHCFSSSNLSPLQSLLPKTVEVQSSHYHFLAEQYSCEQVTVAIKANFECFLCVRNCTEELLFITQSNPHDNSELYLMISSILQMRTRIYTQELYVWRLCSYLHAKLPQMKMKTKLLVLSGLDLPWKPPLLRILQSSYPPNSEHSLAFQISSFSCCFPERTRQNHTCPPGPIQMIFTPCSYSQSLPVQSRFLPPYYVHLLYQLSYVAFFFIYHLNIYRSSTTCHLPLC